MDFVQQIKKNWIGILGLIILCIGLILEPSYIKQSINVIGILLLLIYAKTQKNLFFYYAECVVLLGTLLNIISINEVFLMLCMTIASIFALYKIFGIDHCKSHALETIIGLIGLFGLALGFSTDLNIGFIIGGIFLAIYGFIGFFNGITSALIFAILNLIFGGIAIYVAF